MSPPIVDSIHPSTIKLPIQIRTMTVAPSENLLRDHLIKFGIQHFNDESYWAWGGEKLGEKQASHLDKLRKPLVRGKPKKADLFAFYEFIAKPVVASVVHSLKADAIRATGEYVSACAEGNRILDTGCSIGYLTSWYALTHPTAAVLGIDFSPSSINVAKRYAVKLGIQNLEYKALDGSQLKALDLFDCIVDTQGMIDTQLDSKSFRLLMSWLQPGGKLIAVPAFGSLPQFEAFLDIAFSNQAAILSLEWIHFCDLGERGMYPGMILTHAAPERGLSRTQVLDIYRNGLITFNQTQ
ncbi:methyltransferase domain-containing protein [Accumulibacter sp.]|uniref:methyltransferase domain-containing protein n=1 Tax=Accumulibacter sp. TaxID=2053492 RepID=UPI0035AED933